MTRGGSSSRRCAVRGSRRSALACRPPRGGRWTERIVQTWSSGLSCVRTLTNELLGVEHFLIRGRSREKRVEVVELLKLKKMKKVGAGDGNRTHVASLEG